MTNIREIPASELLSEALEVPQAHITFVSQHPLGAGSVSGFDVLHASHPGAEEAGSPSDGPLRYYVDTSGLRVAEETGLALGPLKSPEARIWMHPADPHLPGLPTVSFHRAAEQLFERVGLVADGVPEFVGYRPGRRAVLRLSASDAATDSAHTLASAQGSSPQAPAQSSGHINRALVSSPRWIKIVRPSRVERIVHTHEACAAAGIPVPRMLAWSPDGVILLDSAHGTPGPSFAWHTPALLDEADRLMERFSSVDVNHANKGVAGRIDWYAGRLTGSLPSCAQRVEHLVADARKLLTQDATRPTRVVHGDLHFGQLFFDDGGRITGVIDVDTTGVGDAAEDPAALIAHATASAMLSGTSGLTRVWEVADEGTRRWGVDRRVRALFVVHALGHALTAVDGGSTPRALRLIAAAEAVLGGGLPSDADCAAAISSDADAAAEMPKNSLIDSYSAP